MKDYKKLLNEFPAAGKKEWMEKVSADLKGEDADKIFTWRTAEGLELKAIYFREDMKDLPYTGSLPGEFPFIRGNKRENNNWRIRQDIKVACFRDSNIKALNFLLNGADSLGFSFTDPETINKDNINILIRNIDPEAVELNFLTNGKALELVQILKDHFRKSGCDPLKIKAAVETDPLGRLMTNGTLCISVEQGFDYLADVTRSADKFPGIRTININGSNFRNAGAGPVMELAFVLSMGTEYLSQLTERGFTVDDVAPRIKFSFATGSDYFPEIARLRSARLLWSAIIKKFKPVTTESARMEIHCVTGRWNKTVYDPHVNMLRTQTEAMAAVTGGADSLTVEPYDIVFREPDEFSERIARNQQLILREESYFGRVVDPAAGSYYVENLTHIIADNAWKLFMEIEGYGGLLESLKKGIIRKKIKESAIKHMDDVARRRRIFVGTTGFVNRKETIMKDADLNIIFPEERKVKDAVVEPVSFSRAAGAFEKIRISIERSGRRPKVIILPVGNRAMSKTRAQFSCDFFACGGFEIAEIQEYDTLADGLREALASGAGIVVLCSSDEEYPAMVKMARETLTKKTVVAVAGDPPGTAGADFFINKNSDAVEVLRDIGRRFGACS